MVSNLPNYYRLLGLAAEARPEEIKAAYRRLAMELHPDRNSTASAVERFQQVLQAYETLSDPERRRDYDELAGIASAGAAVVASKTPGVVEGVTRLLGGLMDKVNRRWRLGQDLKYTLVLTMREACLGCEKVVRFEAPVRCPGCKGQGVCEGSPCGACGGSGVQVGERELQVTVPPGTAPGVLTRIPGGGTPGERGGPEGDLTFFVEVKEHPLLEPDGLHLRCRAVLPVTTAMAGGRVEVPTLEGTTFVRVPPGVQEGQVLRLEGRGIPAKKGPSGDLLITLEVELPGELPQELRRLLTEVDRQAPQGAFPRSRSYLDRLGRLAGD